MIKLQSTEPTITKHKLCGCNLFINRKALQILSAGLDQCRTLIGDIFKKKCEKTERKMQKLLVKIQTNELYKECSQISLTLKPSTLKT